jgi:transposase InsO family protein
MSRRGNCWDSAVAESFFATLKRELLAQRRWATRAEASAALADDLDRWCNHKRRRSSLGYLSPAAFEARLASAA